MEVYSWEKTSPYLLSSVRSKKSVVNDEQYIVMWITKYKFFAS